MTLFSRIARFSTQAGSRSHFEMVGLGDDRIRVLITPDLGPCPSNASEQELQVREILGRPVTIVGTPEEIDLLLEERLNKRVVVQDKGMADLARMQSDLEKVGKGVAAKSVGTATETTMAQKEVTTPEPAPAPTVKAPSIRDGF